jgi:hypothetical protein
VTSPSPTPDPDSVLAGLPPTAPAADSVANFDVARDLLTRVLALHSARRHELEQAQPVDQAAVDQVASQQTAAAQLLQILDPADADQVTRVRAQCASILRATDQR